MSTKLPLIFVTAVLLIAAGSVAWFASYRSAIDDLNLEATRKLVQVVDQFQGQLSAARILPTLLARNAEIVRSVEQNSISKIAQSSLERNLDVSGAYSIQLLDAVGDQLFSTENGHADYNNADSYSFRKAMQGALGIEVRRYEDSGVRTICFARSIIGTNHKQIGVILLELEIETLETEFRARPEIIMFVDRDGSVVFSNRSRLVSRKLQPYNSNYKAHIPAFIIPSDQVVEQNVRQINNGLNTIWRDFPESGTGKHSLIARKSIMPIGLEAILAIDTEHARQQAGKISSLATMLLALAMVTGIALFQRRKHFLDRIEAEKALSKELDRRVSARSKELEQAQHELVQSAKLKALGKMSIGISHELNQPIASIQNFSVNAGRFLQKKRPEDALNNLAEIEAQTQRMSRIIKNLRDFTRKDNVSSEPIDINEVINAVAYLVEQRLSDEGIVLTLEMAEQPTLVLGGEVRLQQVLINIVLNAADAMKNQSDKKISIKVSKPDDMVKITVQDNGPGLADPKRVFEPFYTTKKDSHDDGLGLGLSIAYGFVESFGGSLRATNNQDGGALFTLLLSAIDSSDIKT